MNEVLESIVKLAVEVKVCGPPVVSMDVDAAQRSHPVPSKRCCYCGDLGTSEWWEKLVEDLMVFKNIKIRAVKVVHVGRNKGQ